MPARKRQRPSRRRRPAPGRRRYLLFLILPLALLVVLQVHRHQHAPKPAVVRRAPSQTTAPHHAAPTSAARAVEVAAAYNSIVERAGAESVWLKRAAQPEAGGNHRSSNGEVLALASASRAIIKAMEHQAAHDGLRVQVRPDSDPPTGGAIASAQDISLSDGNRAICVWRLKQVPRLYRAAIVIDDLGQDLKPAEKLLAIPYPLTFSVLPNLPASRETAAAANRGGREVMLHLPMEPLAAQLSPGQGAIRVGMRGVDVDRVIGTDLASVPYTAGVNNHMGSRATSDPALMAAVMRDLASRRLYFIDSRTIASTVALNAARRAGIPAFYRSVFLDDTETVEYTLGQIRRFREAVESHGEALAIGHPHATTVKALEEALPQLEHDDIRVVPASRLARVSEAAPLSPSPMRANRSGGGKAEGRPGE